MKNQNGQFMSSVKVGPKGQIVIPKDVRQMFDIKPGDTLVILGDIEKGIAIDKYEKFSTMADAIFEGRTKRLSAENTEEESMVFAKNIKSMQQDK